MALEINTDNSTSCSRQWIASQAATVLSLALIILLGVILRCAYLATIPDFNADEACTAVYAQHLNRGDIRYLTGVTTYFGPLHVGLVALAFRFLGESVLAARSISALAGILLIPLAYLLGRQLFGGRRHGLAAALLTAVFPAHVVLSRLVYSVALLPTADAVALLFLLRFYREGKQKDAVLAGLFLGVGLQLHLVQYLFLLGLAGEFIYNRRYQQTGSILPLLMIVLTAIQAPAFTEQLFPHHSLAEFRYNAPPPLSLSLGAQLQGTREMLAVAAGWPPATTGVQADFWIRLFLSLLTVVALVAGLTARAARENRAFLLWLLLPVTACGIISAGSVSFRDSFRYFALFAPLVALLCAGGIGNAASGRRALLSGMILIFLVLMQAQQISSAFTGKHTPCPMTLLLTQQQPRELIVEDWWLFWPARFYCADSLPVHTPHKRYDNHVPARKGSAILAIGWHQPKGETGWQVIRGHNGEALYFHARSGAGAARSTSAVRR